MKNDLQEFLVGKSYTKIKLRLTKTNHFEVKATLNGVKGVFILDTGASNSCVGFTDTALFNLKIKDSNIKAAGAGATDMVTQLSRMNTLQIGKWTIEKLKLVIFDLSHVNTALIAHNATPVHGILGADILKKGKAIIDYDKKYLYLKPLT